MKVAQWKRTQQNNQRKAGSGICQRTTVALMDGIVVGSVDSGRGEREAEEAIRVLANLLYRHALSGMQGEYAVGGRRSWRVFRSWSALVSRFLKIQFDKGDFVMVPVEPTDPGTRPCKWRFVLVNEKVRSIQLANPRYLPW